MVAKLSAEALVLACATPVDTAAISNKPVSTNLKRDQSTIDSAPKLRVNPQI
jgi:hypothetical protein